jgi:hypothetical protein
MTSDEFILAALEARVISVDPENGHVFGYRWGQGKPRGCANKKGYIVFTLHFGGERKQVKAHRVIWLACKGTIPRGLMPDHENRKKDDNRLQNLRLVTNAGNAKNRRSYRGTENPAAKIDIKIACDIRLAYRETRSYLKLAKRFDISKTLVATIIRGEKWT